MPRPKKSPRARLHLRIKREVAKSFAAHCKKRDLEMSAVVQEMIENRLFYADTSLLTGKHER